MVLSSSVFNVDVKRGADDEIHKIFAFVRASDATFWRFYPWFEAEVDLSLARAAQLNFSARQQSAAASPLCGISRCTDHRTQTETTPLLIVVIIISAEQLHSHTLTLFILPRNTYYSRTTFSERDIYCVLPPSAASTKEGTIRH